MKPIIAFLLLLLPLAAQAQSADWQHYYDSMKTHPYVMPDSDRARLRGEDSVHILDLRNSLTHNEKEVAIANAIGDTADARLREKHLPSMRQHIAEAESKFQRHYGVPWRTP